MNEFVQNDDSTDSESNNSGNDSRNKKGNARPLGNRFPRDAKLIEAIRKHEEEWKAILSTLSHSLGVNANIAISR